MRWSLSLLSVTVLAGCPEWQWEPTPWTGPTTDPIGVEVPESSCDAVAIQPTTVLASCGDLGPTGALASSHLESLWGTAPTGVCGYVPGMVGGCGMYPSANALYCPLDDHIAYDVQFMDWIFQNHGAYASVAFFAHEWGHLNQDRTGLAGPVSTRELELHADCQAGMFTAFEVASGRVSTGEVEQARRFFASIGDAFPSGFGAVGTHGTGVERVSAFDAGYLGALANLDELCFDDPIDLMLDVCGG